METTKQITRVRKAILILISIVFFVSCNENQKDNQLLDIIINDFKSFNNSKNLGIDISKNPHHKGKYYFIVNPDSEGFQQTYYSILYKSYNINIYDSSNLFEMTIFPEYILKPKEPLKATTYEIDDSNRDNIYVYVINDSIVEKRMIFDFLGDMVEEKSINKKWIIRQGNIN